MSGEKTAIITGAPGGIFLSETFLDFAIEDFAALISTNLLGFFYITQRTVKSGLNSANRTTGCNGTLTLDQFHFQDWPLGNFKI
jgi:hypothetical protein